MPNLFIRDTKIFNTNFFFGFFVAILVSVTSYWYIVVPNLNSMIGSKIRNYREVENIKPVPNFPINSNPILGNLIVNEYNFQFDYIIGYPEKGIITDPYYMFYQENTIKYLNLGYSGQLHSTEYTLFDAKLVDPKDLRVWWQDSMKNELGGLNVPADYDVTDDFNLSSFNRCVRTKSDTYSLAYLEVSPKPGLLAPGPYQSSIYIYYDFGKPFIINYRSLGSGGCSSPEDFWMYNSIRRIN